MSLKFIRTGLLFACALTAVAACNTPQKPVDHMTADAVYRNGRLYTVDKDRSWQQAVAIKDGRIVYVGDDPGVEPFVGDNTQVVDLDGRVMLPAFQDAHTHPAASGIEAIMCSLTDDTGVAEYRDTISKYAAAHPDTKWILGGGWSMAEFGPGGMPSKAILDELVPDRPVYLASMDGHTGWANSKALEIAGIDKNTPNPANGRIDRDPKTGEAIGSLQEGAMDLVGKFIPDTSMDTRFAGIRYARDLLHSYGITSFQDADVHWRNADDYANLDAYTELDKRGELNMRVTTALHFTPEFGAGQIPQLLALRDKYTHGNIRVTTVKIFEDGVMENYTAAMLQPYLTPAHTRGIPMVDPESLKADVTALDHAGFQIHIHAIGDAAVRYSLDAFEQALKVNGKNDHRHQIAHLEVVTPDDVPRFAALNVTANFQPFWAYPDNYITDLTLPFISKETATWLYPIGSIHRAGGRIAFGSDWSVSTPNPFVEMEPALTREDPLTNGGDALLPSESIDLATAIAAFTINAAYVNHQDDTTGSIEVGKLADLIVVDQNPFEVAPTALSDTKVLLTLFGGKPVFGDPAKL